MTYNTCASRTVGLGEGDPSFETILKDTSALGSRLHALPAQTV